MIAWEHTALPLPVFGNWNSGFQSHSWCNDFPDILRELKNRHDNIPVFYPVFHEGRIFGGQFFNNPVASFLYLEKSIIVLPLYSPSAYPRASSQFTKGKPERAGKPLYHTHTLYSPSAKPRASSLLSKGKPERAGQALVLYSCPLFPSPNKSRASSLLSQGKQEQAGRSLCHTHALYISRPPRPLPMKIKYL